MTPATLLDMQLAVIQHMLRVGKHPLGRVHEVRVSIEGHNACVYLHERADLA